MYAPCSAHVVLLDINGVMHHDAAQHAIRYAQAAYSGVMLPPSVEDVDQKLKMTEGSLKHRLGSMCDQLQVPYTLEVVKAAGDAESIGEFICSRAVELDATLVVRTCAAQNNTPQSMCRSWAHTKRALRSAFLLVL